MDDSTPVAEKQHPFTPNTHPWEQAGYFSTLPSSSPATSQATDGSQDAAATASTHTSGSPSTGPYPYADYLPLFLPQQSNVYHAQLLHYNKLISPYRGGGLQTPPLPPVVSPSTAQAGTRSRSSSKVSLKDSAAAKGSGTGGHGARSHQNTDKNRAVIASKEVPHKMAGRNQPADLSKGTTSRSAPALSSHVPAHSASVPSTPHQHARKFSFESREPSPNAANNHSPRSAYSETSGPVPSTLKQLAPRSGGCQYETAQRNQRRRIPYSAGNERLESLDLRTVKKTLSTDEERKLSTDMREVYDRLLPTEDVENRRRKLIQKLEGLLNQEWPGHDIRVHLFGSSGNFLCSDDSDVDICITTSWHQLEDVCMIADLLARKGFEKVVCISAAKVPIVKVWDPALNLACDMNVNNTLALENTRLIRTYVEIDPRVRQLAMLIKYWTRRRIVNDAAFGGTLSSYTWICLIVAFLQLRSPPVLPALHQLPYKMPKQDGQSEFADNLRKLKGFGSKNKSSEAELLFQFFRFYAHEFDYDKYVLSVRSGKLLTKSEKKWIYQLNNQLCVEEPFNTSRNLGNTADEYSFRGLHLELRRAFDMLSLGKFEDACELYIFPKEEEKVWSRPAPQPRPVLLRSASQTHSGRGGRGNHRGGRSNNGYRGNNSSRRASSSIPTYDPNFIVPQVNIQQDMSWYYNPYYSYMQQDLMTHMYPQQQENMRQQLQQLYGQQAAAIAQSQAMGQQRTPALSSGQQSSDRSRTNSFDNAPMSAPPLRTDAYAAALYAGMPLGQPFMPQTGNSYAPYVTAPVLTAGGNQDFRRTLQRSSAASDSAPTSGSSLRSQSQPASRPQNVAYATTGYPLGQPVGSTGTYQVQNTNGVAIPNFMPYDSDADETPKAKSTSPNPFPGQSPVSQPQDVTSPPKQQLPDQATNATPPLPSGGIAFGDLNSGSSTPRRRRLSTDQLPQTILDRRMRRTSRSPSPMGHTRAISVGAGPTPSPLSAQALSPGGPLVVNGTGPKVLPGAVHRQNASNESSASRDSVPKAYDNPLQLNLGQPMRVGPTNSSVSHSSTAVPPSDGAAIVNGTATAVPQSAAPSHGEPARDTSFRERVAMMSLQFGNSTIAAGESGNDSARKLSPSARQKTLSRQVQSVAIAPLDLAMPGESSDNRSAPDTGLLSPVYENRTPSPTVIRNGEILGPWQPHTDVRGDQKQPSAIASSIPAKPSPLTQKPGSALENGPVRTTKGESDNVWQKAGKSKKKPGQGSTSQSSHAEQPPRSMAERKGG